MENGNNNDKTDRFRKESLEHVSSPDQLDTYLKVTSPFSWLSFIAVIILLLGFVVWGIFGHLEKKVSGTCSIADNEAQILMTLNENEDAPKEGMKAEIYSSDKNETATITTVKKEGNDYIAYADTSLPDGEYKAEVVTWRVTPISFVFN